MQPSQSKDPHAAALGQRGGQKRMEQLNAQERSALAKYAARSRWHPRDPGSARKGPGDHLPCHTGIKKRQATTSRLTCIDH